MEDKDWGVISRTLGEWMISESGLWRRSLLCLAYWEVIFTEEEASFGD